MIALVVSPWEKADSGKRKLNDPIKTNIERAERRMVVDPVPFIGSVRMINLT
jgi:hypothetical protein